MKPRKTTPDGWLWKTDAVVTCIIHTIFHTNFHNACRVPRIERIEDTIALPSSGIRGIISKARIGINEERVALKQAYDKEKEAKMVTNISFI